jgi:hypothetical protein
MSFLLITKQIDRKIRPPSSADPHRTRRAPGPARIFRLIAWRVKYPHFMVFFLFSGANKRAKRWACIVPNVIFLAGDWFSCPAAIGIY